MSVLASSSAGDSYPSWVRPRERILEAAPPPPPVWELWTRLETVDQRPAEVHIAPHERGFAVVPTGPSSRPS